MMIKYFNSMKEENNYSLSKGVVVAGVLAATVMTTGGCSDKNSMERKDTIISSAFEMGSAVSEKVSNISQHLEEFTNNERYHIEYVSKNVAVVDVLVDEDRKANIIDLNSNKCVQVDSSLSQIVDDVEYLWVMKDNKHTIIDPNSEKPLDNLTFKYDFAESPVLVGDDLVSVSWNIKVDEEYEHGFQMDFALLNYTTGETLIPEETYDYISVEPELNGVNVYEGKNYPTDFVSFKELGLSQNTKTKSLN